MLASITPLGERGRGFSWPVTVSAFAGGAVLAAGLAGALAGALGSLAPGGTWRTGVALGVVVAALGVDAGPLRRRLPTTRRQVNEDWMTRYRGWVYGVAYGGQLGLGLVTVVTSAAIYAAALGTLLCGSIEAGALVGGAFGLTRALTQLTTARVTSPDRLVGLHRTLGRLEPGARWLPAVAEVAAAGLLLGALA